MALTIEVYRTKALGDCTGRAGGWSKEHDMLVVVNADGPTDPTKYAASQLVALVDGNTARTVKLVPVVNCADEGEEPEWQMLAPAHQVGPMMGGNYGATSDSRFSRLCEEITGQPFYGAVAIHDRYETPQQYAALSD